MMIRTKTTSTIRELAKHSLNDGNNHFSHLHKIMSIDSKSPFFIFHRKLYKLQIQKLFNTFQMLIYPVGRMPIGGDIRNDENGNNIEHGYGTQLSRGDAV